MFAVRSRAILCSIAPQHPQRPFAETLYNRPRAAPPFLHLAYENKFFKFFEFVEDP
jgi:hypothetical protein